MMIQLKPDEHDRIVRHMYTNFGVDLRQKQFLIESKISVACFKRQITSFAEYWQRLCGNSAESEEMRQELIDMLTTHYSYFYREEAHFNLLRQLLQDRVLPRQYPLSAWCAGCASGQEAYTLAMVLEEARQQGFLAGDYTVTGSDISAPSVAQAMRGHYPLADYVRLPEAWRKQYCFLVPGGCEVRRSLRDKVTFQQANLLDPTRPAGPFDFIFCRNVMIYFDEASCQRLLDRLRAALLPGGYLFLGHTEIFNEIAGFTYVMPAVYRKAGE